MVDETRRAQIQQKLTVYGELPSRNDAEWLLAELSRLSEARRQERGELGLLADSYVAETLRAETAEAELSRLSEALEALRVLAKEWQSVESPPFHPFIASTSQKCATELLARLTAAPHSAVLLACISCGMTHDGGYEVEDGPGPFCSQCWEKLDEHFQPRLTAAPETGGGLHEHEKLRIAEHLTAAPEAASVPAVFVYPPGTYLLCGACLTRVHPDHWTGACPGCGNGTLREITPAMETP